MVEREEGDVTALLDAAAAGVPGAQDRLLSLVYDELRRIARSRLRGNDRRMIEPTTLVHEAYIRLFSARQIPWRDRKHFFLAAATAMRSILVDRARRRKAAKRGGDRMHEVLHDDIAVASELEADELIALNDAIQLLELKHPESSKIVVLRFFAGMTREEIAKEFGWHESDVWREWEFARAWLRDVLTDGADAKQ